MPDKKMKSLKRSSAKNPLFRKTQLDGGVFQHEGEVSEEQLRSIIAHLPGFVYRCKYDKNWTMSFISGQCKKITGYEPEDLINNSKIAYNDIIHPAYRKDIYKEWNDALRKDSVFEKEYQIRTGGGEYRWVWERGSAVLDKSGNVLFLEGYIEDITERKNTELSLKESEEKYRLLVENANDGIEITQNDKIIFGNARFAEMLGYNSEEIKNVTFRNIFTESALAELEERHRKRLEGQQLPRRYSSTFYKKDGSVIDVEVTYEIINYRGSPATLAIIRDITELKLSQHELLLAKERAEESDRLKSAFLANMSHEIRTPMNGILGFTELLRNPRLNSEQQQQYIEIIQKSGLRLLNTVNDIIEISKIETGQVDIVKKAVDFHNELDDLCVFFAREAKLKGLALYFDNSAEESPGFIHTDLSKFTSIISNLIKNAIKFTPRGAVHVGYQILQDKIEFYVSDTGIGIPEARQDSVFERFVQADIADENALQGSGLGLAIAKSYTELLDGYISFNSEEGKGSRFFVQLPYRKSREKSPAMNENKRYISKNKPNILICEDDAAASLYLSIILEEHAEKILKARSGEEAIELVRKHPDIDIVLMDIKMPDMGGYAATRKIREFNKEIIIIAQTAHAFSGESEKALDAGCNGYISKPVSEETLLKTIAELWNK